MKAAIDRICRIVKTHILLHFASLLTSIQKDIMAELNKTKKEFLYKMEKIIIWPDPFLEAKPSEMDTDITEEYWHTQYVYNINLISLQRTRRNCILKSCMHF